MNLCLFCTQIHLYWASMVAQMVKNLPAVQETQVRSLGREDPPAEKGMATYSSILAWRIPKTKEPGGLQSMWQRVEHDWANRASLVARMLKNLPAMWETWVRSLGRKDPLEKGLATHSNILAWRILWIKEPGGLQSIESQRVRQCVHKYHLYYVLDSTYNWYVIFVPLCL